MAQPKSAKMFDVVRGPNGSHVEIYISDLGSLVLVQGVDVIVLQSTNLADALINAIRARKNYIEEA